VADRINLVNLVWGIVFTVVGAGLVAGRLGWWDLRELDIALVLPVLLVTAGVVLVLASFGRGRTPR
jgi:hypothetical protein